MKQLQVILLVSGLLPTLGLAEESRPTAAALKQSARDAFAAAETDKGRDALRALHELFRQMHASSLPRTRVQEKGKQDSLSRKYQWSQRLAEVAHEYLRAGQLIDAIQVLGEAADLNLPFEETTDDGLGSAAAGFHRRLAMLDADERFDLLHDWSMPTDTRRTVRVLTSITPTDAPPAVFARALGERSRRDSFAPAKVGDIRGLFCTAWELVTAADEAGSLRRLTTELSGLAEDNVPNARFALTLAKIVGARRADERLREEVTAYAAALLERSGSSVFESLSLTQRVWQFGYGQFDEDADRTIDFSGFPYWDGSTWRGGATHPDPDIGWVAIRADGGHPGSSHTAIRRWVAPADGTLSVAGALGKSRPGGDGVRARLISSRSGLAAQWVVRSGTVPTEVEAIEVVRGDTIDVMVDQLDDAEFDSFSWTAQLHLKTTDAKMLVFDSVTGFHGPTQSNLSLVVAAACLTQDWLQPIGERVLQTRLEQTYSRESLLLRPFLRKAHMTALQARHPDANPDLLKTADLELWIASSSAAAARSARGAVRPIWLAREGYILHQTGPRNDYLFFKYPLTGEFEFSCETQIGGQRGTDGGIAYAGLGYETWAARSLLKVWDPSLGKVAELHSPFVASQPLATFNRLSLKSTDGKVTLLANGHPTWTDTSRAPTSPWVGLRSWGERVPIFRNFKITGNPVIPRQVTMSDGSSLRGWVSSYYGEQLPPARPAELSLNAVFKRLTTSFDWSASEGVIYGSKQPSASGAVRQSRLYYVRPLQNGESISYEFQYEPGQSEVHPTLGRLAILLDPAGVRIHWMTPGDREWTGLPADNSVVEPLNRRGPKPLPLLAGDWNRATLTLDNDTLTVSLNDTTIYTRKMESENERTFGFYHDKRRTAVRVRNVVMRGDWPEQLTQQQLNQLAAVSNSDRSASERRLLAAIFDDQEVHGSVLAVCRRAARLPAEDRYAFLSRWVLPSPDHETLRLALDFTPTNPAPPAVGGTAQEIPDSVLLGDTGQERKRITTGGDLVSPALDLVAVAKELGKLDDLRERVAALPEGDELQQRSRLAMLALIDIGLEDIDEARDSLDKLASLVAAGHTVAFHKRWPETLAIWSAAPFAETRDAVRDMAQQIIETQIRKTRPSGYETWNHQIRALASRVRYYDLRDRAEPREALHPPHGQSPLADWVPASHEVTRSRGQGFPRSHWALSSPATVDNFASHYGDYLFYRTPLRGNFEVEAEVGGFGWWETSMWVAGRQVGPVYTYRHYDISMFRSKQRLPLDPPMHKPDTWIRHRTVVRDGVCTTYFNGRKVLDRPLAKDHDPWVAVYSPYSTNGAVRNVRITGTPEIPTEVRLTAVADLPGWLPINEGNRVGATGKWKQLGDLDKGGGIHGIRWADLPGSHRETLLRYHRPMVEDGTIEYEFYYRPGETLVHPALDRLAFLLQPDGVRVHWVTDDKYDRTGLAPDNLFDERDNRRGPETLPLAPNAWNRLQLSLTGDTVDLKLNGELVYQRQLEATNQRTFGLFHYADRTEALVRNVVWRGDWPRELPAVTKQELAGEGTEFLDQWSLELTAAFEHDFAKDGLPSDLFAASGGGVERFDAQADGVHVTRPGGPGYFDSMIAPRLAVEGDFDIIAAFEHFESMPAEGGSGGLFLEAILDNAKANECRIYRRLVRHRATPQPIVQASYVTYEAGGTRRSRFNYEAVEAAAGRLRLARRGETVYFMFAEGDSPNFRLFGTQTSTLDNVADVRLSAQTQGEGVTKVVWKSVKIRADRIKRLALADQAAALVTLDKQRDALPQRFAHNFAKDPLTAEHFNRWGPQLPPDSNGLRVLSLGADNWTSAGIASLIGMQGDFDIAINFDDLKFGEPKENENSAVYFQIEFPDQDKTQASLILINYWNGDRQIYTQVKVTDSKGKSQYRRKRAERVDELEQMRIARRGKRLSFIYRKKGSDQDLILAHTELMDLPIPPNNIRLILHTGGAGRQSELRLRQFEARAERISPNPSEAPAGVEAFSKQLTAEPPASGLEFDGRTQYVTVPSIRYDGSHPITLEAFVTPDDFGGVVLGDTQQSGIGLATNNRKFNVHAWNGKGYDASVSSGTASRFLRVHLAGTFDGKTLNLFVNGKLSNRRQLSGPFTGSSLPLTIGASPSPREAGIDFPFDGVIDQARVSKTLRYTQDFAVPDVLQSDANTMALFQFDEGRGARLGDSSGNKHHGEVRGAKWVTGDVIRLRAAQGLVEFGRHGVEPLTEALADDNPSVQLHAIAALGRIGEDANAALPALKKLAAEGDPSVKNAAKEAIGQIETRGVLKSILNLFNRSR